MNYPVLCSYCCKHQQVYAFRIAMAVYNETPTQHINTFRGKRSSGVLEQSKYTGTSEGLLKHGDNFTFSLYDTYNIL
jgi:hypothetical protein